MLAMLAILSLRPAAAAALDCAVTYPVGTTLNADITVYPNFTVPPGDPDYTHGFTTPSAYFAVSVGTPGQAIAPGVYGAFCVDQDHYLAAAFYDIPGDNYTGNLISICDPVALDTLPNRGGVPALGPTSVVSLETWHKVNYILNHKDPYYFWNIQVAIHRLVGGPTPNDPALPSPEEGYPPATASEIDAILADAEANAATWTVPCGGVTGVLFFVPDPEVQPEDGPVYQIIVIEVPKVCLSAPAVCATVGSQYSSSLEGGAKTLPYTYTISAGALPPGLTLDGVNGVITGIPTATGVYNFSVTLTDSTAPDAQTKTISATITVSAPVVVACAVATGDEGQFYSSTVSATGGSGVYTYAVTAGALPDGLTLNPATGAITGIPTRAALYSYTITATDNGCGVGGANCTILIKPPVLVCGARVTVSNPTICAGEYSTLTANGSPGSTYLWNTGATTQSITVTPSATTTYSVTVTAPNGCQASATGTVTVTPFNKNPGSFNFAGSSASTGAANVRTYTDANGVSVKVTAFSRSSAGVWKPAFVGAYSGGLGITDVNEDGSAPGHTVDNVGNDNYLLFEFSQPIIIDSAAIGYVATDSDLSLRIGTFVDPYNNHLTLSDAVLASFGYSEENAGGSATRTADVNAGEIIGNAVVIAASLTDKAAADQFKLLTLNTLKPVCYSPVSVGNFVWNDLNQNGIQDGTEPGINGVKLTLTGTRASGGTITLTTTTSSNGAYLFAGMEPGTYTVTVDASNFATGGVLNGWTLSPTLVGSNRGVDSNPSPTGTTPALLPGGSNDLTLDFGYFLCAKPTVSVASATVCAGDTVTLTATGTSGVTYLWNTGATTQSITVSPSATTTYSVTVKTACGSTATTTASVTVNGYSSVLGSFNFAGNTASTGAANVRTYTDANGVSVKVTGFSRTSGGVWKAAYVGAYSGGLGVTDVNEDGSAPGHTVDNVGNDNYLLFEFSQPVIVSSATLGYVTGDSDLSVRIGTFADPYNSHITLSDSALAAFGYSEENAGGSSARTATLNANGVIGNALVIAASLTDKASADQFKLQTLKTFKPVCYAPVTVGNFVWNDANQNGIQDSGEAGINGVKLTLTGTRTTGGTVTLQATTAGNGAYLFTGLAPGTYTVTVDASNFTTGGALAGLTASPTVAGTNRAVDSNINPSATSPTTLLSGASDLTVDFGFFLAPPPPTCVPTTFDFNGSSAMSGTSGNTRVYTVNGVTVRASAFSRDRSNGAWARAYLGAYGGGLGVTDSSEGDGSGNSHTVDNVGRDNFVLFEFSQPVVVNRAYLGYVVNDSDLTAWVGSATGAYTTTQMLSDTYLNALYTEENNTSLSGARWADLNATEIRGNVLIIAASTSDATPEDNFKIQKIDICAQATPPPPADCVTSTFAFSGSTATGGTAGNIRSYTVNGVSVKASAFSRTTSGTWNTAYLGAYSGGLGVTDGSEGDGSGNQHTVDNVGRRNYVLFEFSQPVMVNRAYLGYVVGDSDLTAYYGMASNPYSSHITLSDAVLAAALKEDNDTTATGARWADLNQGEVMANVLVIAASVSDDTPDDYFKIQKLEICATAAASCPSPWTPKDIGCTVGGYASHNSGTFTVKGSGSDIWGTSDGFRYVYQPASGDCSIVVRTTSVQNSDLWAKAGIMIRESLNGDAKHASMFITPGNGAAFQCRTSTGGSSLNTNVTGKTAPTWLKIVRSGSTFTGYYSTNGSTWTVCGSQTISMNSGCYIGIAVTSHNGDALCTATFDSVTAVP